LITTADQDGRIRQTLRWGATSVLRFPLPISQLRAAVVQALGTADTCSLPKAVWWEEPAAAARASFDESPVESEPRDEPPTAAGASDESHIETECTAVVPLNATEPLLPLKEALEGPEREIILRTLRACDWNRNETAKVLDINRNTLYKKMKKHGLFEPYGRPRALIGVMPLRADRPG
jgi:transcriptional regulator with GAF, ATPase, and Fis domain